MSARALSILISVGAVLLVLAPTASAQSIAARVAGVEAGKVRMSFASRPGVCGDGRGRVSFGRSRAWQVHEGEYNEDWRRDCEYGPVRVVLRVRDGEVTDIDTYVGGHWRAPTSSTIELGTVSARDAARYLLDLARRYGPSDGGEAIFPAMLADSVTVWPDLLDMAKDESLARDTRKSATFWLSQEAAAAATAGLEELAKDENGDRAVRRTAVFALSQRPDDEGVPALIRLARSSTDPDIRGQALFWLGQSDDPRVIALFEEILTGG
jgi:hypothetical protein